MLNGINITPMIELGFNEYILRSMIKSLDIYNQEGNRYDGINDYDTRIKG